MSFRKLALSVLASLVVCSFGCDRVTATSDADGALELTLGGRAEPLPGSLAISGMDGAVNTRVVVSSELALEPLRVQLPAGLYSLKWEADLDLETGEPLVTASAPRLVVVAAGRISSVRLTPSDNPSRALARHVISATLSGTRVAAY